jgi:L-alanine-DL-glutamate epimerase-like enolase superfamily enzyme
MVGGYPDPETLLADLPAAASRWSAAHSVIAGLDAALHDLVGKLRGVPVHQLVGLDQWAPIETAHTIAHGSAEDAAAHTRWLTAKGFRAFKIKAGVAGRSGSGCGTRRASDPRPGWILVAGPSGPDSGQSR